jgi:hypothetical protein
MNDRQTPLYEAPFWKALALREEDIARQWLERICADYPPEAAAFIAAQTDPFANPLGDRLRSAARAFARVLIAPNPLPEEEDNLAAALEELMRVRALQAFTPEKALGVFFDMKEILRAALAAVSGWETAAGELRKLDARVDRTVLTAFGQYSRCRETLSAIRENEIRRRQTRLSRFCRETESGGEERP